MFQGEYIFKQKNYVNTPVFVFIDNHYLTGLSVFLAKGFLSIFIIWADFFFPMEDWLCASSIAAGDGRDSRLLELLVEISQSG